MTSLPLRESLRARGLYPHQVDFVEEVLGLSPNARVLLADPVGLGKGVACAALVGAYEMKTEGKASFLILAPSGRIKQWVEYLRQYAEVYPFAVDAPTYRRLQVMEDDNPWSPRCVVTSLDFAKEANRLQELCDVPWDIVVIDEAHLCTPHSLRGRLFEQLWQSPKMKFVIAVTATPMRGRGDELIAVLDTRTKMIRRSARELKDWDGRPLFSHFERRIEEVWVEWTPAERAFVWRVVEAVRQITPDAAPQTRFLATQILRRLGSSMAAIEGTLRRRMVVLQGWEGEGVVPEEELESEDFAQEGFEPKGDVEAFSQETCKELLKMLEEVEEDSKWKTCCGLLGGLQAKGLERVVIFSEFADTAVFIGGLCRDAGWAAEVVTGRTPVAQRQASIEKCMAEFGILVLTSEASESLALSSFMHAVHYDVPWNPPTLFRRLGRFRRVSEPGETSHHYFLIDGVVAQPGMVSKLLELESAELGTLSLFTDGQVSKSDTDRNK